MGLVEGLHDAAAVRGEDPMGARVRRTEEHSGVEPEDLADVGVDDSAVTGDDDPLALVREQDSLDRVRDPHAELRVGLGVGIHVPRLMAGETCPCTAQRELADHLAR